MVIDPWYYLTCSIIDLAPSKLSVRCPSSAFHCLSGVHPVRPSSFIRINAASALPAFLIKTKTTRLFFSFCRPLRSNSPCNNAILRNAFFVLPNVSVVASSYTVTQLYRMLECQPPLSASGKFGRRRRGGLFFRWLMISEYCKSGAMYSAVYSVRSLPRSNGWYHRLPGPWE